jgi:proline iminopeptidase
MILETAGFTLQYTLEGTGPSALVIGSSIYYPRTFSQNLREHLKLIFMDHRGFGKSKKPFDQSSFTIENLIEDIEACRKILNIKKIILIGHSGHGHFALEYAKKYPDHVSHLVIIAMSPDSTPESFAAADQYFADSVCPERKAVYQKNMALLPDDIQKNPARTFIDYSLRSGARIWYDYSFDASFLWENVTLNPEMFDLVWGQYIKELDILSKIDRLDMPVLVALGRYDYWNPPHLWEKVRNEFQDLTIQVFEKSGHSPQLEEPKLFDMELLRFLGVSQ